MKVAQTLFGLLLLAASGCGEVERGLSSCEVAADCPSPAKNVCIDGTCACDDGYITAVAGATSICLDFDECAAGIAGCDETFGYCVDWDPPVKFKCACLPGYICTTDACTTCIEDPGHACRSNNGGCGGTSTCVPLPNNGTKCECEEGFEYDGLVCVISTNALASSPTPAPFAECATVNQPGSIECPPETTCEEIDGKPYCICNSGYTSTSGLGGACFDIDECAVFGMNNCTGSGRSTCVNLPGTYRCQCNTGFTGFPGSIAGTDCRTLAEIEAALSAGGEICFTTGLTGLSASDVGDGQPAREVFVAQLADFFDLDPAQIVLSNITDTVTVPPNNFFNVRKLQDALTFTEEQLYAAFTCEVCVTITELYLDQGFTSTTTTSTGEEVNTIDVNALNQAIKEEITRVRELFLEQIDADATGNTASVTDYLEKVIDGLTDAGVNFDEDRVRQSYLQGISFLDSETPPEERTPDEILEVLDANEQFDSPLANFLRLNGVSVSPTAAPSQQGARFLGLEEEDFFGDFSEEFQQIQ